MRKVLIFTLVLVAFSGISYSSAQALTVTPRIEVEADPGTAITTNVKVSNEERESRTFYLRYENFHAADETGNPTFTTRQEDLATWIETPLALTLGPGQSIELPIKIDVPANADPGGHFAAIFFASEPPTSDDSENQVALGSKLGVLILLRVKGDFIQNANILEFATTDKQKFYTQLPIGFYYRFQNTGYDHQKPVGDIQITNIFGWGTKALSANSIDGSVLPKSVRKFTTAWTEYGGPFEQKPVIEIPKAEKMGYWDSVNFQARHFLIGRYKATLKLGYNSESAFKTDKAEFVFYIFPWQFLSIAVPVLISLLIILHLLIKRYNRYIIRRAQKQIQNNSK